jgi:valyl-tRNA synthetase
MAPYFESMAGAQATAWGGGVAPPHVNARFTVAGSEVFVDLTGLIDVAAEIAKNEKERERVVGFIASKEKKLANESFVARAPAAVVEQERQSLDELRSRLASIEATLNELSNR